MKVAAVVVAVAGGGSWIVKRVNIIIIIIQFAIYLFICITLDENFGPWHPPYQVFNTWINHSIDWLSDWLPGFKLPPTLDVDIRHDILCTIIGFKFFSVDN